MDRVRTEDNYAGRPEYFANITRTQAGHNWEE